MKLGELIAKLEAMPAELPVRYATVGDVPDLKDGSSPGSFMSYRGYYERLAIDATDTPCTVAHLLTLARLADGTVMEGYKGGDFKMTRKTLVHVSEYGHYSGNVPVAIENRGDHVAIVVVHVDDF